MYRDEIPSSPTGRQDSSDNPWLYLLSPSGEFINDFGATVEAHMLIAPDGTYETSFSLPDGQYTLEITGTGSGDVHVLTRHDHSAIEQFQPVPVDTGDLLMLDWQDSAPVLKGQQGNAVEYSGPQNGVALIRRLSLS